MTIRHLRLVFLVFLAGLVAACGQPGEREDGTSEDANPLLWEIARADGSTQGWLLGTIHALPDGSQWRNAAVDRVVADADLLAVEIASLDDGHAMARAFTPLATSPGQPPLTARVSSAQREPLTELVGETSYRLEDFGEIESWGAALILSQAVRSNAKRENGIDRALIDEFARDRVIELEGAQRQFAVFDTLSESAQRAMLASIVEEAEADPARRERPVRVFLSGDADTLERLTREGILGNPEIRTALLTRRNADWLTQIERMLAEQPRPLIAVGAAHMVGDDGLVALLEAKGYRVTRVK